MQKRKISFRYVAKRLLKRIIPIDALSIDHPRIAVIKLAGIISSDSGLKSGLNIENLNDHITKAFNIPDIKAVALIINSPGGSAVQSEFIYNRIRMLAIENKIPVYSFVEDCAASGGYWLACSGDEIYASGSSIIGSIGVISAGFGFVDAIKKIGIERRVYKQGENKAVLDPFTPERQEEVEIIMRAQQQVHQLFKDMVRSRRIDKIKNIEEKKLFSGEFWCGIDALDFGLIDGLGDIYNIMAEKFGKDVKLIRINKPGGWLKRKLNLSANDIIKEVAYSLNELELKSRLGL